MTKEEKDKISGMLIVKEPEEKEPYAIEDSRIVIDVAYESGSSGGNSDIGTKVSGSIVSSLYINNTDLEYVKSWRFEVYGLKITGFSVDTRENVIVHRFVADSFEINDYDEDEDNGKAEG